MYKTPRLAQPLIGGCIKIEMQKKDAPGTWQDVTAEILSLGIAGRNLAINTGALAGRWNIPGTTCADVNPNAIIRLQRVRDVPLAATTTGSSVNELAKACGFTTGASAQVSQNPTDYWPNALYDTREGSVRDGTGGNDIAMGGIMHYVELDMANLKKWLTPGYAVAPTGSNAMNENGNGFIVYFSDRRGNKLADVARCAPVASPCETGEYGWEDVVNLTTADGLTLGVFDKPGEDLNANDIHDLYGKTPQGTLGTAPFDAAARVTTYLTNANTSGAANVKPLVARANRTLFYRRALKIVNGSVGNIITPGLTIASENPVYIQGDFNSTPTGLWTAAHSATAIIADSVTTLSNAWNDIRSFVDPVDSKKRIASPTSYRVAIVSGKGLAFAKPSGSDASFGSDGGVHNFMRNLEDWDNASATHRYRGSLVSFFISRQAVGTFKCCAGDTYVRGPRDWTFDSDFLIPSLLPPGTPMFRDINTLTFRQLLRPNQ